MDYMTVAWQHTRRGVYTVWTYFYTLFQNRIFLIFSGWLFSHRVSGVGLGLICPLDIFAWPEF